MWLTIQQVPGTKVHIYAWMQSWDESEESSFLHTQTYIRRESRSTRCVFTHTDTHVACDTYLPAICRIPFLKYKKKECCNWILKYTNIYYVKLIKDNL